MKKIFNFKLALLATVLFSIFATSCKDEVQLPAAERLFRPIIGSATVGGTWFLIHWDQYKDAKYYQLELSTDTFQTVIRTVNTDSAVYKFNDLEYDMAYQIRIRAIGNTLLANGDTIKSDYNVYEVSTVDFPTQLKSPSSSDMIDKSIRVSWNTTSIVYTRIDIMLGRDSVVKTVALSASDNEKGEKVVSGLKPGTTYLAMIYAGNEYKGKKSFKTLAAQVFEGDVIDLRDSLDSASPDSSFTKAYKLVTPENYPNGVTIILAGGQKYIMETPMVTTSVHIVTGLSLQGYAIMQVSGNFDAPAAVDGAPVANLTLEKIIFTDHPSKPRSSSNFGGTYVFNFSAAGGKLGEILIKDCDVRYKRGFFRIKAATTIDKVTIDNCIMDSIGGYGILNLDNGGAMMTDMIITNSTFSHFDGYLCRDAAKTNVSPNSLYVENVTTCYAPASTRYLFELTGQAFPGGITIKDNVFGTALDGVSSVNGIKTDCTNLTIENNFKTSDLIWAVKVGETAPTYPIESTELGTITDVFKDPAALDFHVTDSKLVHKAGDPRWW